MASAGRLRHDGGNAVHSKRSAEKNPSISFHFSKRKRKLKRFLFRFEPEPEVYCCSTRS